MKTEIYIENDTLKIIAGRKIKIKVFSDSSIAWLCPVAEINFSDAARKLLQQIPKAANRDETGNIFGLVVGGKPIFGWRGEKTTQINTVDLKGNVDWNVLCLSTT